jgi:hypothetical protein
VTGSGYTRHYGATDTDVWIYEFLYVQDQAMTSREIHEAVAINLSKPYLNTWWSGLSPATQGLYDGRYASRNQGISTSIPFDERDVGHAYIRTRLQYMRKHGWVGTIGKGRTTAWVHKDPPKEWRPGRQGEWRTVDVDEKRKRSQAAVDRLNWFEAANMELRKQKPRAAALRQLVEQARALLDN